MFMSTKNTHNKLPAASAYEGTQLSLFQNFLCNSDDERDRLSNTIELWDGVPKYYVSRHKMRAMRSKDGNLPTLEREFEYRKRVFTITIQPARIKTGKGKYQEFYPSAREELVEDALRKIAAEQQQGFLDGQDSGAVFSLHMLRQELRLRGHAMSYEEVVEALEIMSNCTIQIRPTDGKGGYQSPILTSLTWVTKERYRTDPKSRWVAYFSPLVTQSIKELSYRQYDYQTMMMHTSQLSRWLHKRLAHHYTNASLQNPYRFKFSSVQRDSGLLEHGRPRDAIDALDDSLNELKSHNVLITIQKEKRTGTRNKILDVLYTVIPNPRFIEHIKAANRRQAQGQEVVGLGRESPRLQTGQSSRKW